MAAARTRASWSDLHPELLSDILNRLEILDSIRFRAVCTCWRSLQIKKPKPQIPWLLLSSPSKPQSRFFYSLTERKKYEIHLPGIAGFHSIGSSRGFLFVVDRFAQIHAFNPLTGIHFPLPPPTGHSEITDVVRDSSSGEITHFISDRYNDGTFDLDYMQAYTIKVIMSPRLTTVIVIHGASGGDLSFARVGEESWTLLNDDLIFQDIIFHKDLIHAIDWRGTLAIFNDGIYKAPFISTEGPLDLGDGRSRNFLVESPNGEDLFLIYRKRQHQPIDGGGWRIKTLTFKVFKLDKSNFKWNNVETMGDFAVFVGYNDTKSFSDHDFPCIKRNTIYFTDDYWDDNFDHRDDDRDQGIFSLEDGCIRPFIYTEDFQQFKWPTPIWFSPVFP